MKASELIRLLEQRKKDYGDIEVSCVANDSYFSTNWVSFSDEDNEIQIECR